MMKKFIATAVVAALAAPSMAGIVFFDYADIRLTFNSTTGILAAADHAGTSLKANLRNNHDIVQDQANITSSSNFDVLLSALVVNPAGADNISLNGSITGTDTTMTTRYDAAFGNTQFGADLDGITFAAGILTINGRLSTHVGNSILVGPAGDWVFAGTDDLPDGPGADGIANQFTVGASQRDGFDNGTVFVLEISLPSFNNGASTLGFTNADDFFAAALMNGGFDSTGGDMKVSITPVPGALLLGALGLGAVAHMRRRYAKA